MAHRSSMGLAAWSPAGRNCLACGGREPPSRRRAGSHTKSDGCRAGAAAKNPRRRQRPLAEIASSLVIFREFDLLADRVAKLQLWTVETRSCSRKSFSDDQHYQFLLRPTERRKACR